MEATLSEHKAPRRIKILTPWTLAHGRFLHATLQWENRWAPLLPDACSKPAWETFGRPNRWATSITWYSPSHPWDKPVYYPRQTDTPPKNEWTMNWKLAHSRRVGKSESTPEKEGKSKGLISIKNSLNKQLERQAGWSRWAKSQFLK
jgi:hypothetical protein